MSVQIEKKRIRVRAAPSPTGSPQIGNLRTFLFDYLAAKHYKGTFILRIEDTDKKREVEKGIDKLYELLDGYGMKVDEGPKEGGDYGPYIQSERKALYLSHAEILLQTGHAYKCFCSEKRLAKLREQQKKEGRQTRYDGKCRNLTKKEIIELERKNTEFVIRLKVPTEGICEYSDLVFGKVSIPYKSIDDQILIKKDGFPTYHFGVVVDDYLMKITHVLRGSEYISSTPKDVLLYKAFGWEIPEWVHLPMVVDQSGKKFGKRSGALPAVEYLRQGYLPEAVLNYLALLGWNPGDESTVMSVAEMVKKFTFERIHKSPAKFDAEKFLWLNGQHIRLMDNKQFLKTFVGWLKKGVEGLLEEDFVEKLLSDKALEKKLSLIKERSKTLLEAANQIQFFYFRPDKASFKGSGIEKASPKIIEELIGIHKDVDISNQVEWEDAIRDLADRNELKHGDVFMQLRLSITGSKFSPPLRESLEILGRDEVLERLQNYASQ